MQIRQTVLALAVGIATITAAVPAMAGAPSERVSYADLRLGTAEGHAELQKRLNKAAWRVCMFDDDGSVRSSELATTCYRATRKDVAVQMAQVLADRQLGG
jgi:UrcA family protein